MYIEAQCRLVDPVYGCVKTISHLRQEIDHTHTQLAKIHAEIAFYKAQFRGGNHHHQNPELPASSFHDYVATADDHGGGFHHPTPPPSSSI